VNPEGSREKLLAAAARMLAELGFAGTTTRRVAEEAGVNEVTLFRHFGTKERLLEEAVRAHGAKPQRVVLPAEPGNAEAELTAWCQAHLDRLRGAQRLLRRCLGEQERLPLLDIPSESGAEQAAEDLRAYVAALRSAGRVGVSAETEAGAIALLVSALLVDALAREDFAGVFSALPSEAGGAYARTFLATLGIPSAPSF
jgi:AcrR family transcriptional regulator